MADKGKSHISVRFTEAVAIINEAGRTIEAYSYDAKREPKALLDIEKDRENNRTFILNEKLLHKHTKGRTINGIREIFREKTGKEPSKDATIRATILTMPINEIKGLNFNLTMQEAVAIEKHNNSESLDAGDEKALESAKEKLIHLNYTPEQMQQIYDWVEAAIKAICKVNGIKRSDILYAVLHCNGESSPHLHLGFIPCVYLSNQKNEQGEIIGGSKQAYEDYHKDIEKRNSDIQADIEAGMNPADARALHPPIKRPKTFDGDINREIADDEPAYGSSANRFNKYFLKYYLDNIQREMQALGVETQLRNGNGHTFDVCKKSHAERTEEKFEARIIEMKQIYEAQIEEAKAAQAKAIAEKETAQAKAQAYEDKASAAEAKATALEAEASTLAEEVAKASEELEVAQAEAIAYRKEVAKATETLEEMEIELADKEKQVSDLKVLIKELQEELSNLVKEVVMFVPKTVKAFIGKWKEAKTISQMEKVDAAAQAEAIAGAKALTENLRVFGTRAEALLAEEEVVSGVKMATFERTDQKIGFAKKQVLNVAEATGQAEAFEDERVMALALQDWFNREKYKAILERKSEVEASLYMKAPLRAERAIEYALEKVEEMEEVELG